MRFKKASELLADLDISFTYGNLETRIDFIAEYPFPPGGGFDSHAHSTYEFHYIREGKGHVAINGSEFPLVKGCFYITGPGVIHKQAADKISPMVEYALRCNISYKVAENQAATDAENDELQYILHVLKHRADHVVADSNGLQTLFENIFTEVCTKKPGYFSGIGSSIFQILLASARNYTGREAAAYSVPTRDTGSFRLQTLNAYIDDNINKNITRRELASHLFLSIRQTDRLIRKETGLSTHGFVLHLRIESVKQMLERSGLSLLQIAERTGFSSEYHLSNAFKKHTGVSPSAFRKRFIGIK